jgi:hypothetical protein
MLPSIEIDYDGEGLLDAAVARKVIVAAGCHPGRDFVSRSRAKGKDALDRRLRGLAAGARYRPILVLRDLDADAPCGGGLAAALWRDTVGQAPHPGLLLRVAVRSVEAWLLADTVGIARATACDAARLIDDPDGLQDPKAALVALLRSAPARGLRSELGLRKRDDAMRWPLVAAWLDRFVAEDWDPRRASGRSPSLRRCLAAMQRARRA